MQVPDIIIAVDGYSSTGKSTFAKLIASSFGFLYLDSGALYRGVTLFALERGLISAAGVDEAGLRSALPGLELHFERDEKGTRLFCGPRCIEGEIRTMEVSSYVSPVSALPFVRSWVDEHLHAFSESGRVVMDGRDIGTTVFPQAEVKLFMTARSEVRARRRYDELVLKGENPDFEEVLHNLEERDRIDSSRAVSPLRRAADAFVLDNSEMSLEEELIWLQGLLQGKFGILEA
ncbi:MAG: (d)CMP kinase [Bacteroidales bacterium]|nr:(d)CMP kinase [Bacteroidales bacterium]